MGAEMAVTDEITESGEPRGAIIVKSSKLKAIKLDGEIIPRIIDEIPIIAVAATQAEGVTEIRGAKELRVKESDRIKTVSSELRKLGAKQNTYPVTAREIEGLIRLSESSAKMRLSPIVELQDAERAVYISSYVLNDIFMDRSTGRIDSDIISIGQPKSKVDKLRQLLGVINALEQQYDLVDIDEIVKQAASLGFEENYARRLIDELKRQGDLYEPKVGFVKSSRGKEW